MATQLQLALRRQDAYRRIEAAARTLAKATGTEIGGTLDIRHRDPQIEQVLRLEAVADMVDALAQSRPAVPKLPATDAPVTVETVEIIDPPKPKAKSK